MAEGEDRRDSLALATALADSTRAATLVATARERSKSATSCSRRAPSPSACEPSTSASDSGSRMVAQQTSARRCQSGLRMTDGAKRMRTRPGTADDAVDLTIDSRKPASTASLICKNPARRWAQET